MIKTIFTPKNKIVFNVTITHNLFILTLEGKN